MPGGENKKKSSIANLTLSLNGYKFCVKPDETFPFRKIYKKYVFKI